MTRRIAVGYMLAHATPARQSHAEQRIRSVACKHGFQLVRTVVIGPRMDRPIGRLLDAIDCLHAAAAAKGRPKPSVLVITPDLEHVDKRPATICQVADLLTVHPERLWTRERSSGQAIPVDL
ncbi:hypothetical protein OH799_15215 [Nocardia sp. NBC_00881]|uniref:hypothetical protein n=1 Tax=Nocardia sp. NBC_00881 TaxID=2975995 RepID=UPI00386A9826|nr:hypothetical protein OH799_15215 [Nocardia sp. NBC_00881]